MRDVRSLSTVSDGERTANVEVVDYGNTISSASCALSPPNRVCRGV